MMRSQPSILEITVVSAEGIKNISSTTFFSSPPKPFITLSPSATCPSSCHVYKTKVDDEGGVNPTWGDKFEIPLEGPTSGLYLHLFTKRGLLGRGPAQIGWCHVPLSDVLDGPVGRIRNLSYRVRAKDGSRGEGVVNVVVRLIGSGSDSGRSDGVSSFGGYGHTAIGIPITMFPTSFGGYE